MKEVAIEPDFIGGLEPLTTTEAATLAAYFAAKKTKANKLISRPMARATDQQKTTT